MCEKIAHRVGRDFPALGAQPVRLVARPLVVQTIRVGAHPRSRSISRIVFSARIFGRSGRPRPPMRPHLRLKLLVYRPRFPLHTTISPGAWQFFPRFAHTFWASRPVTPWGKAALGLKTRKKNKPSNKYVLRKRRKVSKRSRGGRDS